MDRIFINQFSVDATIGIHAWEKAIKQKLILDLELGTYGKKAAASDNIKDALDYHAVIKAITTFIDNNPCELVETLAENIATLLQKDFKISWLTLKLTKPQAIKNIKEVGIMIERGSHG